MEEKSKKNLRTLSKVISVLAKIGVVFMAIAIGLIAIAACIVPVVRGQIKMEDHAIIAFDRRVEYEERGNEIVFKYEEDGEMKEQAVDLKDAKTVHKFVEFLNENNLNRITAGVEVALLFAAVTLVITLLQYNKYSRFFKNIAHEDTPFTDENCGLLRQIAKYALILLIVSLVSNIITSLIVGTSITITATVDIIRILVLYAASYIFEYACKLQSKSKEKLYTD